MQIWSYLYELQQWLVSERATDGRVCVCVWLLLGKCTQCVCVWSSAVKCYSRWPFRWCRGGITVTVWQNRPQPPCNGWALSRWTPFLPLPPPPSSTVSSFPPRPAAVWPPELVVFDPMSMKDVLLFAVTHRYTLYSPLCFKLLFVSTVALHNSGIWKKTWKE